MATVKKADSRSFSVRGMLSPFFLEPGSTGDSQDRCRIAAAQHVRVDTLGTQQFSSPSGQEEASRGKPGGDRGGESSERVGARIQAAAADPEEETMSYISVRV